MHYYLKLTEEQVKQVLMAAGNYQTSCELNGKECNLYAVIKEQIDKQNSIKVTRIDDNDTIVEGC